MEIQYNETLKPLLSIKDANRKGVKSIARQYAADSEKANAILNDEYIIGGNNQRQEKRFKRLLNKYHQDNLEHTADVLENQELIQRAKNGDVDALIQYQNKGQNEVAKKLAPVVIGGAALPILPALAEATTALKYLDPAFYVGKYFGPAAGSAVSAVEGGVGSYHGIKSGVNNFKNGEYGKGVLNTGLGVASGLFGLNQARAAIGQSGLLDMLPHFRIGKWHSTMPNVGNEKATFRQFGQSAYDDIVNTGVVRSKPHEIYLKQIEEARKNWDGEGFDPGMFVKSFANNLMFNRKFPFYSNKANYPYVAIGNMNDPNINWIQNFHKRHKYIFEPHYNGKLEVPVEHFDVYRRGKDNFGWIQTHKAKINK